jgi:hypothetical protein
MRYYFKFFLLLIVSTAIYISCSDSSNPGFANPMNDDFIYPLKVGNKWNYQKEWSRYNFRPDSSSPGVIMNDTTFFSTIEVSITRIDTIADTLETFVLYASEQMDNQTFTSGYNYNNTDDGLFIYAYRGGTSSLVYPKKQANLKYKYGEYGSLISNEIPSFLIDPIFQLYELSADSIGIENPPVKTLSYPFKINNEWTYRNTFLRINKKVVSKEIVNISAGQYECYKVQWLYDFSNSGEWSENIQIFDYISSIGLIKRIFLFKDVTISTTSNPNGFGLMDGKEEMILTGINF